MRDVILGLDPGIHRCPASALGGEEVQLRIHFEVVLEECAPPYYYSHENGRCLVTWGKKKLPHTAHSISIRLIVVVRVAIAQIHVPRICAAVLSRRPVVGGRLTQICYRLVADTYLHPHRNMVGGTEFIPVAKKT